MGSLPEGVDYYRRLVGAWDREGSIELMFALYQWDLQQALQERGSWIVRETSERLVSSFGSSVVQRPQERTKHYCNRTATRLVRASTQRTNVSMGPRKLPAKRPNLRTYRDGLGPGPSHF